MNSKLPVSLITIYALCCGAIVSTPSYHQLPEYKDKKFSYYILFKTADVMSNNKKIKYIGAFNRWHIINVEEYE